MTRKQEADKEQAEAQARLLEDIKPGDTIYTILRHRSASGMLRVIDLVIVKDGQVGHIGWNAAIAMGDRYDREREGIRVGGCGMDMGFHLVYNLGAVLWPDGFECTGEAVGPRRCHSNDHTNGDRDYSAHMHRNGGYALNHRWL